jgi:hypothetical protein
MAEPKTFLERAEGLIKALGTIVTIVVVFGYPAIYFQLKSYNLPLHVIGYKNVLAAGVIPTLLFVGFFFYGRWVYQEFQKNKSLESILTLAAVGMPLLLLQIIAAIVVVIYGLMWLFFQPVGWFGIPISKSTIINISMIWVGIVLVYQITTDIVPEVKVRTERFFNRIGKRLKTWVITRISKQENQTGNLTISLENETEADVETTKTEKTEQTSEKTETVFSALVGGVLFGIFAYVGYLALMWIIEVRFPGFDQWLKPYKSVLYTVSIAFTFIVVVFFPISAMKDHTTGRILFFGLFGLAFIGLMFVYSTQWYKNIDIRLGGGKPTPINIWVKTQDFPRSVLSRYQRDITADSSYTNWQNGLLLIDNDKEIAITTRDSIWVIIAKDKVVIFERAR